MMEILLSLFGKKRWIDAQVVDTLRELNRYEYSIGYHNAIRTLNHIYVVDQIFRAHLLGISHGFDATNTAETPSLDALGALLLSSDDWYISLLKDLSLRELKSEVTFKFTDGDFGRMTKEEILFHVLDHGTNHRGNIAQILKDSNVAPARDLLTKYLRLHRNEAFSSPN